jgi:hypothetical protein
MSIFNKQLEDSGRKLSAQGSAPSTLTTEGAFYVKIVSGIAEGFYVDDQGQEVQLTNNGAVNAVGGGGGAVDSVNGQTGVVVLTTSDIAEGTNQYYTEAKVNSNASVAANTAKVSADGSVATHSDVIISGITDGQVLAWSNANSRFEPTTVSGGGGGAVDSVNGQTGVVVLDADGIDDTSTTNKFTTAGDISKLAGIQAGAEVNPDVVPQAEAEAGTATTERIWTAERVAQAIAAQAGGGAATVAAFITVPTGASLSDRATNATGLPAGWSLVLGNDGSVDPTLSGFGAVATDLVLITGEGKTPATVKVMKNFGGIRQEVIFNPSTGEILENAAFTQVLLKDPENGTKAGTDEFYISVVVPA